MRIAITSDVVDWGPTSLARYTRNLLNIFDMNSEFQTYAVYQKRRPREYLHRRAKSLQMNSPHFHTRNIFLDVAIDRTFLLSTLKKYPFDIVHFTDLAAVDAPPLVFHSGMPKVIVTIHGVSPLILPSKVYWPNVGGLKRLIFRYRKFFALLLYKLNKINTIITVSLSEKQNLMKYMKIPEDKIKVIYNGVEASFRPLGQKSLLIRELEEKYKICFPFILHVSVYQPTKNVVGLIKAFHKLRKLGIKHKLVLVDPPAWGYESVIKTIEKYHLQREVVSLGYLPDEDLVKFYNLADLFVFPSLHEAFGLPVVEAMACGCPVVTSNVYSLPEIVGDAAVLINPCDTNELSSRMFEILTNEGLREDLCKKGVERAKMFSWKRSAREHLDVYREALSD